MPVYGYLERSVYNSPDEFTSHRLASATALRRSEAAQTATAWHARRSLMKVVFLQPVPVNRFLISIVRVPGAVLLSLLGVALLLV